jgi:hypothetical protein
MGNRFQAACDECKQVRPLFLSRDRMLCERCATKPPASAYAGSVVTVFVFGVFAAAALFGLAFLFILRERWLTR